MQENAPPLIQQASGCDCVAVRALKFENRLARVPNDKQILSPCCLQGRIDSRDFPQRHVRTFEGRSTSCYFVSRSGESCKCMVCASTVNWKLSVFLFDFKFTLFEWVSARQARLWFGCIRISNKMLFLGVLIFGSGSYGQTSACKVARYATRSTQHFFQQNYKF